MYKYKDQINQVNEFAILDQKMFPISHVWVLNTSTKVILFRRGFVFFRRFDWLYRIALMSAYLLCWYIQMQQCVK